MTIVIDRAACRGRRHGDYAAYSNGCRCPDAREDHRLYDKRRREGRAQPRRVPNVGTRRRLQALAALGWRRGDIAAHLGSTFFALQHLAARDQGQTVLASTALRVRTLFVELADTPGPSELTRQRALAKGWAPPAAWDDIDDPNATPDFGGDDESVDNVLVRRVLQRRAAYDALNVAEKQALWRAWAAARRARLDGPGLDEFAATYGLTKSKACTLRYAAEGRDARGRPITAELDIQPDHELAA